MKREAAREEIQMDVEMPQEVQAEQPFHGTFRGQVVADDLQVPYRLSKAPDCSHLQFGCDLHTARRYQFDPFCRPSWVIADCKSGFDRNDCGESTRIQGGGNGSGGSGSGQFDVDNNRPARRQRPFTHRARRPRRSPEGRYPLKRRPKRVWGTLWTLDRPRLGEDCVQANALSREVCALHPPCRWQSAATPAGIACGSSGSAGFSWHFYYTTPSGRQGPGPGARGEP